MNKLLYLFFLSFGLALFAQEEGNAQSSPFTSSKQSKTKKYQIAEITVEGHKDIDPGSLIAVSGLVVGETIEVPGDKLNLAMKRIWAQNLLGDVKIEAKRFEGTKVYLVIRVTELPRISRVEFEGVNKTVREELTDKVKVVRGMRVTDAIEKNIRSTVYKHFAEKGFRNCEVKIRKQPDNMISNGVALYVAIDKKSKVKINDIIFEGATAFEEKKLLRKLKKTKEIRKLRLYASSKFISSEYASDKAKLITYYNKNAFRNATIVSDSVYDFDEKSVNIVIRIEEGKKFYYRNIYWTGNYLFNSSTLDSILAIKKGEPYDTDKLEKRLHFNPSGMDVTSLYMDNGYLFFSVEPIEHIIGEDSVDLELKIFEGDQATVGSIIINGNTRTSDHVIRREIEIIPGDKFNRSALIRTNQRLAQMGYFDPEKIGINPKPNMSDGTVDIEFNLEEKSSDQIELSGGWGGNIGFIGTLGVVFNNFSVRNITKPRLWSPLPMGDGQKLAVRFQANGRFFQNYSFTFTEPWFGGKKPHSFSFNLSHSVQRRALRTGEVLGGIQISGATISSGRRLTFPDNNFSLNTSLSYLRYNVDNYSFGVFRDGISNSFTLNNTIARYTAGRNPIYPTYGSNISLSINATPPFSAFGEKLVSSTDLDTYKWVEYHKWMFDSWWFLNLANEKLVLVGRAHMGFIGRYNKNVRTTPFERFMLGGDGMMMNNFLLGTDIVGLRGYENNSLVPKEFDSGTQVTSNATSAGGIAFVKYVVELRYPLSLNPSASIYLHSFIEAGNNWGRMSDFNPFKLYRSAGVGARIFMPAFGMLGVDFGYGFDAAPGTNSISGSQFHFVLGQQIR